MAVQENLQDLYRSTVLEHSRSPHHFGPLGTSNRSATGHNPLCGDKCTVYLEVANDTLRAINFEGAGCAICVASASIMTDAVRGCSLAAASESVDQVMQSFTDRQAADDTALPGDMAALGSVRQYPSRIRCATLAWQTLQAALTGNTQTVTTEVTTNPG
ncbi:MAG: Fe-S cluster assembly sulfur transfer protein SufU [Gammaproteobacteria bacterium]